MKAPDPAGACRASHVVDIGFVNTSWAQVAVLGIVQGVTELLPISSTVHQRVLPGLLGWPDPGSAFFARRSQTGRDLPDALPETCPSSIQAAACKSAVSSSGMSICTKCVQGSVRMVQSDRDLSLS